MLPQRVLGKDGSRVSAIGYGAMVLEGYYGSAEEQDGIRTIQHALEIGVNFIDTADAYGNGHNETLVAQALRDRRANAFIATKFGIVFDDEERSTALPTGWGFSLRINGRPEYAKKALDRSLQRLGIETIDLWYLHYPDPGMPIEDTVDAMADAVRVGKVRYLGLSNVNADEVRRAYRVHPIAAVQYEYSLWRREAEQALLPALRELGVALVPWSPLGSGFLTGTVSSVAVGDFRSHNPKYTGGNLKKNADRFAPLLEFAATLKATPAQLALAWLLHQGDDIIPIPGTRKAARIDENVAAIAVTLDRAALQRIDELAPRGLALGETLVS
jgi:aryl-alcohol dehydrogenase-like predicted oxidoreductase